MPFFHCYREHRFNSKTLETLERANVILDDMADQGYVLTLRQLYYRFVANGWIENSEREYKRLGRLVTSARESGVMDWLAIEDRGRTARGVHCEEDPAEVVNGIEAELVYDRWARQSHYLEVWVEKQALESVVARPASRHHVRYMACKGYLSASEAWRAGLRFQDAIARGKEPVLVHLADHDPSGLDMTEDNRNRVNMFAETEGVEVRRIALNMDQVREHNPPPNPAKTTDSRYASYIRHYGKESWELDALLPSVLDGLIDSVISEYVDPGRWSDVEEQEEKAREPLAALSDNWPAVQAFMKKEGMY